jgi:hypothetical protein
MVLTKIAQNAASANTRSSGCLGQSRLTEPENQNGPQNKQNAKRRAIPENPDFGGRLSAHHHIKS